MKTVIMDESKMAAKMMNSIFGVLMEQFLRDNPEAAEDPRDYFMVNEEEAIELFGTAAMIAIGIAKTIFPLEKGKTHRLINQFNEVVKEVIFVYEGIPYVYTITPFQFATLSDHISEAA